jgi:hypothetical protein
VTGFGRLLPDAVNSRSRPSLCENHRRPDQSDGTRQKIALWFDAVHFSWVSFIRIKNRRINSAFSHSLDPLLSIAGGRFRLSHRVVDHGTRQGAAKHCGLEY